MEYHAEKRIIYQFFFFKFISEIISLRKHVSLSLSKSNFRDSKSKCRFKSRNFEILKTEIVRSKAFEIVCLSRYFENLKVEILIFKKSIFRDLKFEIWSLSRNSCFTIFYNCPLHFLSCRIIYL